MEITIGRTVIYRLTEQDAAEINRRRTSIVSIRDRIVLGIWSLGTQAHIGNDAYAGQSVPLVVTAVNSPGMVNGQAILDGNDVLWARTISEGTEPGTWSWPPRA